MTLFMQRHGRFSHEKSHAPPDDSSRRKCSSEYCALALFMIASCTKHDRAGLSGVWQSRRKNFSRNLEGKNAANLILGRSPRYIVTTKLISAVLTRFCRKSPSFGKSYRTRNSLTRFCRKSPTFGKSYRTRNSLTIEE